MNKIVQEIQDKRLRIRNNRKLLLELLNLYYRLEKGESMQIDKKQLELQRARNHLYKLGIIDVRYIQYKDTLLIIKI